MDKNTNKILEGIKNKIDKKAKAILDCISKFKQEIIGHINKPWYKDSRVMGPLIITIILAIIISCYFSARTDKILEEQDRTLEEIKNIETEIKNITTSTEEKVDQLLKGERGLGTIKDPSPPIKKKIIKTSITPDGTIALWVTLNRPDTLYQKGYIFDIGDSLVKNRMSLLVDENGFLNWGIYESNYNIHVLKSDIKQYLKGERFYIALTWSEEGELIMYINAKQVSKIKLDKLNLNISSEDMYWGSDIEGNYVIHFG